MRTTVELTDAQRAELLKLAARRGEKGFSSIVQVAIDRYLADEMASAQHKRVQTSLEALGSLDGAAADRLAERVAALRNNWR